MNSSVLMNSSAHDVPRAWLSPETPKGGMLHVGVNTNPEYSRGMRLILALFVLCLPLGACSAQPPVEASLTLRFIDVGQGDAILIQAPNGQNVLIDGGRYQDRVLAYLRELDISSLDLIIASHADFDHIHGLIEVVSHYRPTFFMDNAMPHTTQTYAELLMAVQAAGSQLLEPTQRTISLGDVSLRILPPPGDESLGQNDNSIGVIVTYGDFRASLTGDSEAAEWNYWENENLLEPVQVHKSSHHGSENGDIPLTMSRLQPEVVVISVGEGNSYGHPTERALRLYAAVGASIYRTDLQGSITVKAQQDGSYDVEVERQGFDEPLTPPTPSAEPAPEPSPPGSLGSVVIQCVRYNPEGADDGNEVVTLYANETTDVTGWWLEDEANHRFSLSGTLEAGRSYGVRNTGGAVWNNTGDTAFLFNAQGQLVDAFSYGGGGVEACR